MRVAQPRREKLPRGYHGQSGFSAGPFFAEHGQIVSCLGRGELHHRVVLAPVGAPGARAPDDETTEQRGAAEQCGRLLGMIDVTHWALRRLPSTMQAGLDPHSHAGRFLLAVEEHPGLSNQELAERLGIDETEASRIGRRLLAAGVVWRRKAWRRNAWDITPRGRNGLINAGLASPAAEAPELAGAVGITMLPGRVTGTMVDADGNVLRSDARELGAAAGPARGVDQAADLVGELISGVLGPGGHPLDRIGLGVEVAGHVSPRDGTVVFAPNYGPPGTWDNFPLGEKLQEATGLVTVIENDANALAEYEYVFGAGRDTKSLAVIMLSPASPITRMLILPIRMADAGYKGADGPLTNGLFHGEPL